MTAKPKRFTKSTLPSKPCVTCGRPFGWRKKWARVWDEVKYCSDRCRGAKPTTDLKSNPAKT
jgi:hypothetical protein